MNFKRLLFLVKVEGLSCWPFLAPGKRYLATSLISPQKGDFVVFRDKENKRRFLVKKVIAKERNQYRVASTLPLAQKNDHLTPVPAKLLEGKLICITQNKLLS